MIELYISETCPYCRKVIDFLEHCNLDFEKKDIALNGNLDKLISLGGFAQVPFLYDKDKNIKMYESDDIIDYLKSE